MKRKPRLYLCRKIGSEHNAAVEVDANGSIAIRDDYRGILGPIPRSLARLLAKRIMQALEEK